MRSPAGPKGHLITGHLAEFRADRLGFFTRCAREWGDIVPLRLLHRRIVLLSRPDLIEEVLVTKAKHFVKHFGLRMYKPILGNGLVTSEGDFWRRQRKLAAPAFQPTRLARYADDMVASAQHMLATWTQSGESARDVHEDFMRLSLEIACRTLFGADTCPDPRGVGQAMEDGLRAIAIRFGRIVPIPDWVPVPSNLLLRRSLRTIDAVITAVMARQGDASGSDNLLGLLFRARDEAGSGMADAQLLDEVRTLFIAGHETTALALTYALYLLAHDLDCQRMIRAELETVLGERPPRYEDLPNLVRVRGVVHEALRLYPPADVLGREAVNDCTIGGYEVKKGTSLFMSTWVMHRDVRYFEDPEKFSPARWTPDFERALPRFAYFPFGGGPRFCIGQSFAMAEAILVLAAVFQRFSIAPDPTFQLELWPSITLRPRAGVRLRVAPVGR